MAFTKSNELQTRIMLKYDSYANWTTNNPVLLAGEVAIATIPSVTSVPTKNQREMQDLPNVVMKVGDGSNHYNDLKFVSALAADVYDWAKAAQKPSDDASEILNLKEFVEDISDIDTNTQYEIVEVEGEGEVIYDIVVLLLVGIDLLNSLVAYVSGVNVSCNVLVVHCLELKALSDNALGNGGAVNCAEVLLEGVTDGLCGLLKVNDGLVDLSIVLVAHGDALSLSSFRTGKELRYLALGGGEEEVEPCGAVVSHGASLKLVGLGAVDGDVA